MKTLKIAFILLVIATINLTVMACQKKPEPQMMAPPPPFGTAEDIEYSKALWETLLERKLVGPEAIENMPYPGQSPHGKIVETISSTIKVKGHTGKVYVKANYAGSEITQLEVIRNRNKYLDSITVMFQRKAGYDPDNQDWFWVKYAPDGELQKNPKGMRLAGRVAKGMPKGCIACHQNAEGDDYIFTN